MIQSVTWEIIALIGAFIVGAIVGAVVMVVGIIQAAKDYPDLINDVIDRDSDSSSY